ncbi:MAG: ribosome maturation factor RimM [Nocardioidaceae bacterium]|nr:ribosome maturation factor RimM [Nocardioidaceae bacterium]
MLVTVGRVGRAHGIRGDVTVDVRTDEPDRRFAAGTSLQASRAGSTTTTVVVESMRWHSGRLLLHLRGVDDRNASEALGGHELAVQVDAAERPEDDEEYYDHQLVGLTAVDVDGVVVGTVTAVLHLPAQDTLAITRDGGAEVLVPFVLDLVPEVDLAAGRLVVADVPGLLDPDAAETAPPDEG